MTCKNCTVVNTFLFIIRSFRFEYLNNCLWNSMQLWILFCYLLSYVLFFLNFWQLEDVLMKWEVEKITSFDIWNKDNNSSIKFEVNFILYFIWDILATFGLFYCFVFFFFTKIIKLLPYMKRELQLFHKISLLISSRIL